MGIQMQTLHRGRVILKQRGYRIERRGIRRLINFQIFSQGVLFTQNSTTGPEQTNEQFSLV